MFGAGARGSKEGNQAIKAGKAEELFCIEKGWLCKNLIATDKNHVMLKAIFPPSPIVLELRIDILTEPDQHESPEKEKKILLLSNA